MWGFDEEDEKKLKKVFSQTAALGMSEEDTRKAVHDLMKVTEQDVTIIKNTRKPFKIKL